MRKNESDADEFDVDSAGHPQGKHIIDRRNPRFHLLEGPSRGPLAGVGTARYLAVASRARGSLLWVRAGSFGTRCSLVVAKVGQPGFMRRGGKMIRTPTSRCDERRNGLLAMNHE